MTKLASALVQSRERMAHARHVLHHSKDDATGQALRLLIEAEREREVARLLIATDIGEVRAAQGAVAAYQRILDYQQVPAVPLPGTP